jgi:D-alanyl-D-alanine carboxypeptidase (penicillin-binding protein 5/6)
MQLNAKTARLLDCTSGEVLYDLRGDFPLFPASVTKLATALVLISHDKFDLGALVSVSKSALLTSFGPRDRCPPHYLVKNGTTMGLRVGEIVSVETLLNGLLIPSGNDAANVIAEHLCGTVPEFVTELNVYLKGIGCHHTHFMNPHGIHHTKHVSTASDLSLLMGKALDSPVLMGVMHRPWYKCPRSNLRPPRMIHQLNLLAVPTSKYFYPKLLGGKTGHHRNSGWCVLSAAKSGERTLVACVMGCPNNDSRFNCSKQLFEFGFDLGSQHN